MLGPLVCHTPRLEQWRGGVTCSTGLCGGGGAATERRTKATATAGEWFEPVYGEGPQCCGCHVVVQQSFFDKLPTPLEAEVTQLQEHVTPRQLTSTYVATGLLRMCRAPVHPHRTRTYV